MTDKPIFFSILFVAFISILTTVNGQREFGGVPFTKERNLELSSLDLNTLTLQDKVRALKNRNDIAGTNIHALPIIDQSLKTKPNLKLTSIAEDIAVSKVELPEGYLSYLRLDDYHLPKGAKLFVTELETGMVHGAYTRGNNRDAGRLILGPYVGSYMIEYNGFHTSVDQLPFKINQVYGHTGDIGAMELGYGTSFDCMININCEEGRDFGEVANGVVRIRMVADEGIAFCTGSLMNNTAEDQAPYVLSAYHCENPAGIEFNPQYDMWLFDFIFEGNSCANPNQEPQFVTVQGAEKLAEWEDTDMMLVRITDPIPISANAYFNGWDITEDYLPAETHLIHHPNGDIKKIAQDFDSLKLDIDPRSWDNGTVSPSRSHYRSEFDNSTYQPGSSGAPLFDDNQRVIGQLHGGPRSDEFCTIAIAYSGRLSESWNSGESSADRLKEWLDPLDLGVTQLDGRNSDAQEQLVEFKGRVVTPDGISISNVSVSLAGDQQFEFFTGDDGRFVFDNLSTKGTFTFSLDKDINVGNGLTSLDVIMITNHILDKVPLSNIFQELSADVSGDGRISSLDLVQITNIILGRQSTFPNNTSWRFEPEVLQMSGSDISTSSVELVVIGFKMGDVNNSADPRR